MSALPTSVASAIRRDIRNIAEQSGPTNRPDATPYFEPFAEDIREALARNAVPRVLAKNLHKRLAEHVPGLTFRQVYDRILRMRQRMREDGTTIAVPTVEAKRKVVARPDPAAPKEVPPPPHEQPPHEEPRTEEVRAADGDPEKTRAENLRDQLQHTQQSDDGTPTRRQSREDLL